MTVTRREAVALLGAAGAFAAAPIRHATAASGVTRAHGETLVGFLKYPPDFKRFEYVNPDAPKAGRVSLRGLGAFNSFNPYIIKGDPALGVSTLVVERLMVQSLDTDGDQYGLLAEWVEWPDDYSWAVYKLRDTARWHDGEPITAADVIYSFNALITEGAPLFRFYYGNVEKVTDEGGGRIRFAFNQKNNRELPHIVGQLPVFAKHYWQDRTFAESSLQPFLGSGPYKIGTFEANRFVEFERVADYWGAALPVNIGAHNFEKVRVEYFTDDSAALEAFKSGALDYRAENSAKNWATAYDFPAVRDGRVKREEIDVAGPDQIQGFAFNLRRDRFADRRVREAFALAFNFAWSNKAVFFDQYARPDSYFQGNPGLMAHGLPDADERAFLDPHADQLPSGLFDAAYEDTQGDPKGGLGRRARRQAQRLLREAGWTPKDGKLVNADGAPFEAEFLIAQRSLERMINPYIRNLEQLGIVATLREVDPAQYVRRRDARDFDIVVNSWINSPSPGNEQREYWGSSSADTDGSRNIGGVKNPVIDDLIEKIIFAPDRDALEAASRALDRVLLWERYNVMMLYAPLERIAYWDRIAHPDPLPSHAIGYPTVWWSKET